MTSSDGTLVFLPVLVGYSYVCLWENHQILGFCKILLLTLMSSLDSLNSNFLSGIQFTEHFSLSRTLSSLHYLLPLLCESFLSLIQSHLSNLLLFPFVFLLVYFSFAVINTMNKNNAGVERLGFRLCARLYVIHH